MNGFYVYLHRRADTGEPFYVGKGKRRSPLIGAVASGVGLTDEQLDAVFAEASQL
jgi:hypothetical protein